MQAGATLAISLIVAMFSISTSAQTGPNAATVAEGVAPSPAVIAPVRLPHKLIYPGDQFYPEALAKSGVQGEVRLQLEISKDRKLLKVDVIGSSLSAELDKNALSYVNSDSWKLPEDRLLDNVAQYTLSVIFNRDSILTINTKTCAEFTTDLSYFRSIRPDDEPHKVAALELIASVFTVQLIKTQGAPEALKYTKSIKAISADTINACTEKPETLLIESYVKAAREHKIKF